MGYPPHAANDIIEISGGLFQDFLVLGMEDIHATDIEFDGSQQRTEAIVQVAGDTLAFVLPYGDFRKDLLPLQSHVSPVMAYNGSKKVDDYCSNNYRKKNSNIQDLVFHLFSITWQ